MTSEFIYYSDNKAWILCTTRDLLDEIEDLVIADGYMVNTRHLLNHPFILEFKDSREYYEMKTNLIENYNATNWDDDNE